MSIIFSLNEATGKVKIFPWAITNGERFEPCMTKEYADKKLLRMPFSNGDWSVVQSDEPSEKLLETLKGVRFDTYEDAEMFINGGGYEESIPSRLADIELVVAEMIGGAE